MARSEKTDSFSIKNRLAEMCKEVKSKRLTTISISVNNRMLIRDFGPDVDIDYDQLQIELEETPSLYVFYANLIAELKLRMSAIEAIMSKRIGIAKRELIIEAKELGISLQKHDVDDIIQADEKILQYKVDLMIAKRNHDRVFSIMMAMRMKNDNLRSLSGFKRLELEDSGK